LKVKLGMLLRKFGDHKGKIIAGGAGLAAGLALRNKDKKVAPKQKKEDSPMMKRFKAKSKKRREEMSAKGDIVRAKCGNGGQASFRHGKFVKCLKMGGTKISSNSSGGKTSTKSEPQKQKTGSIIRKSKDFDDF